jgi:hypothetical protein
VNQFCYYFESFLPAFKSFLCHNIGGWLKKNKKIGGVKMTHLIKVENKFEMSRGDILVCRKSFKGTVEEQRVSSSGYEYQIGEEDYLEISVDNQQEELGPCKIDIWSNGPVTFVPPEAASVTVIPSEDVETNTSLRIPSGPPTWKLEIMKPISDFISRGDPSGDKTNVTVGDDEPGGWG